MFSAILTCFVVASTLLTCDNIGNIRGESLKTTSKAKSWRYSKMNKSYKNTMMN
uniref:Uncharacterized protein n=1 Tax=Arundo donax TaxID=35708 RepID=A0A0A8Z668_ARUDO